MGGGNAANVEKQSRVNVMRKAVNSHLIGILVEKISHFDHFLNVF